MRILELEGSSVSSVDEIAYTRFTSSDPADRAFFRCVAQDAPPLTEAVELRLALLLAPTVAG